MKKLIKYLILYHTILYIVVGVGIWFILKQFFPTILIYGYSIVPIFFYVFGLIFLASFWNVTPEKNKKMVNLYMIIKVVKIVGALAMLIIYNILYKPSIRGFAIIFLVFYFINLIWETYLFTKIENHIKLQMVQNKIAKEQLNSEDVNTDVVKD